MTFVLNSINCGQLPDIGRGNAYIRKTYELFFFNRSPARSTSCTACIPQVSYTSTDGQPECIPCPDGYMCTNSSQLPVFQVIFYRFFPETAPYIALVRFKCKADPFALREYSFQHLASHKARNKIARLLRSFATAVFFL